MKVKGEKGDRTGKEGEEARIWLVKTLKVEREVALVVTAVAQQQDVLHK